MSSKKKTTQTQTYGWQQNPGSADITKYRDEIGKAYDTADPTIPYTHARMRESAKNRFGSPFGADYSPEVREAQQYNDLNEIDQMQGEANRIDSFNRKQGKAQAYGSLAGMTAPQLTGTGGTSVQSQSMLPQIIGAGASLGSSALM